jgi:hypothetical protein
LNISFFRAASFGLSFLSLSPPFYYIVGHALSYVIAIAPKIFRRFFLNASRIRQSFSSRKEPGPFGVIYTGPALACLPAFPSSPAPLNFGASFHSSILRSNTRDRLFLFFPQIPGENHFSILTAESIVFSYAVIEA